MNLQFNRVLVTGSAGFIGFHLAMRLLKEGLFVTGIDNLNSYYDVNLKKARLNQLKSYDNFVFYKVDLSDNQELSRIFQETDFDVVVNLAAQAGVRYSLKDPMAYVNSNLVGFTNILECCRHSHIKHLVFASSSSVFGANTKTPFSVHHNVDHPVSIYAATKKANELLAHSYSHLFGIPCTGLRFFTVYGPWGRPDLSLFVFTKAILNDEPIKVFNHGNMKRDFTYIDDVVEGVIRVMHKVPEPDPSWDTANPDPGTSYAPYKIYNIGNNKPVDLMRFIEIIENALGKKAEKKFLGMQPGDVVITYADIDDLIKDVGFKPSTPIEVGVERFIEWYREFFQV